ncbi:MAG: MFS transporter [Acidobacteria bacterium]|nr:MFS transporter [Acidobacteriota bacterium]
MALVTEEPRPFGRALGFLIAIRLVLNVSVRFVYPFLPVLARGLGEKLNDVAWLVSVRSLAALATPVVVSTVGRGERRRRLIGFGIVLFATGSLAVAVTGVWVGAVVSFVLIGLAKPVFDVAQQAYVADRVPYEKRARVLGMVEVTWAAGFFVGAPVAGWLISRWGWRAPFWLFAASGVVALLFFRSLLEPEAPGHADRVDKKLTLDRSAVGFLVVAVLFMTSAELMFISLGAWLENDFAIKIAGLGGIAAVIGLAELLGEGGTITLTDRMGKRNALALGMSVAAIGFSLIPLVGDSLVLSLVGLFIGIAGFEFTIVSAIPFATEIRPLARTRFLSLMTLSAGLGRAAGAYVGVRLFAEFGYSADAWAAAALNVFGIAVLFALVRPDTAAAQSGNLAR